LLYVSAYAIELVFQCYVAVFLQHGASQEDFVRGEVTPALKEATFDFASLANTHLLKVFLTFAYYFVKVQC